MVDSWFLCLYFWFGGWVDVLLCSGVGVGLLVCCQFVWVARPCCGTCRVLIVVVMVWLWWSCCGILCHSRCGFVLATVGVRWGVVWVWLFGLVVVLMVIMVVAGVMVNVFTVVFCTEVCGACMVWLLLGLVVVGLVGVFVWCGVLCYVDWFSWVVALWFGWVVVVFVLA